MSSKTERNVDKTSGSKMLKKAKSFKDDVKTFIKRRPSTSGSPSPASMKNQKPTKAKPGHRASSIQDPVKIEKSMDEMDADKLRKVVDEVYRSLKFIQEVIDKEKLQIVPGSATHVLNMVMDIFSFLNAFFNNQDRIILEDMPIVIREESIVNRGIHLWPVMDNYVGSCSMLLSRYNQVYQCLATFIRWADNLLLHGDEVLDKDGANQIIKALSEGIKELTQLSVDKLELRNTHGSKSPTSTSSNGHTDSSKRASLPEIPLSPRERDILDKTKDIDAGLYDNTLISKSSDSIMSYTKMADIGPPKPPLPTNRNIQSLMINRSGSNLSLEQDIPPPLPEKGRPISQDNLSDSMTTQLNRLIHSGRNQSPVDSCFMSLSSDLPPGFMSSLGSDLSFGMGMMRLGHQSTHSQSTHSQSTHSQSTHNSSPMGSLGSGLNQSSEEIRASRSAFSSITSSTSFESNKTASKMQFDQQPVDQINKLAMKMNMLPCFSKEPPPLPNKQNRMKSTYDNVDALMQVSSMSSSKSVTSYSFESSSRVVSSSNSNSQYYSGGFQGQKASSNIQTGYTRTGSQETCSSTETFSSGSHSSMESLPKPPPIPPKQRHIQAYMQTIFGGSYTEPNSHDFISRHSINFYEAQWTNHQTQLHQSFYPRSNTISLMSDISNHSSDSSFSVGSADMGNFGPIPPLPKKRGKGDRQSQISDSSSQSESSTDMREKSVSLIEAPITSINTIELDPKRASAPAHVSDRSRDVPVSQKPDFQKDTDSDFSEMNILDDIDVTDQLVRKKEGEEGNVIRGGSVDALIVHATSLGKNGSQGDLVDQKEFMFQEAFLTTYRTFINPKKLLEKLLYRFHKFEHADATKKRLSRNVFSLLTRVIVELGHTELDDTVMNQMMDLVFELLCQGELAHARMLRRKIIEKCENRKTRTPDPAHYVTLSPPNQSPLSSIDFLHAKSLDIAEQMTLLDAELFQKIEIPEVLMWAKEQSEELSPNLTMFTEHFNKMSYWCRTRILSQDDSKDREKFLMKFIKIMRHLRKMSNFNSYLAILSAVDSAPVRRLEWQKQNLEALKEFCQLIDSSASFRAYRQALGETDPPCIPYIGLILQDLTFVNIGNQDTLGDGNVNFAKCWQQFNILDAMRRFKTSNYDHKKNEKILAHFDNFNDYMSEDALWLISEKIKPRISKKKAETTDS